MGLCIDTHCSTLHLLPSVQNPIPTVHFHGRQWSLLNCFQTGQSHCGTCQKKWGSTDSELCECGDIQTLSHIVHYIIIIIERRDYGGMLSEDCEDTEQSSEKVSKVRETVLRTRNCQTLTIHDSGLWHLHTADEAAIKWLTCTI